MTFSRYENGIWEYTECYEGTTTFGTFKLWANYCSLDRRECFGSWGVYWEQICWLRRRVSEQGGSLCLACLYGSRIKMEDNWGGGLCFNLYNFVFSSSVMGATVCAGNWSPQYNIYSSGNIPKGNEMSIIYALSHVPEMSIADAMSRAPRALLTPEIEVVEWTDFTTSSSRTTAQGVMRVVDELDERRVIFDSCHNSTQGLHGIQRMVNEIRMLDYDWPRMTRDVTG